MNIVGKRNELGSSCRCGARIPATRVAIHGDIRLLKAEMQPVPRAAFFALLAFVVLALIPRPATAADKSAEAATPPPIRFRNVAQSAGINFVLDNSPTENKYMIESVPGGVAAFDYNGDGLTDIYFTNGAAIPSFEKNDPKYFNRLYRNEGNMKFSDVTGEAAVAGEGYSMGVAAADYDNDGDVDLFVAGLNQNTFFRNDAQGHFDDVTKQAGLESKVWSVAGGWFDYDNDGLLDLFVVNYLKWAPELDRFCGDRSSGRRIYCSPTYFEGLPNSLYRNRGDGTFEDVSEKSGIGAHTGKGMSVAFADYDQDGHLDAFVTNDTQPNFLFRNAGDGTFQELALLAGVAFNSDGKAISSMGVDFRDYDNDAQPDLNITALTGQTFPLFRNRGKGNFQDASNSSDVARLTVKRSGWSNAFADFNNDGWKDLFTANSHVNDQIEQFEPAAYKQPNSILVNLGNGKFRDVSSDAGPDFQHPRAHRGAAFADFNRDGKIDVVVSSLGGPAELWENVSPGDHAWITLKLVGTKSNRDGIGARVLVGNQANHMTSAVGYASSSHRGVHFGLGKTENIDVVKIEWPSGIVQNLAALEANQVIEVREPD